jgi:hypothetical protein
MVIELLWGGILKEVVTEAFWSFPFYLDILFLWRQEGLYWLCNPPIRRYVFLIAGTRFLFFSLV